MGQDLETVGGNSLQSQIKWSQLAKSADIVPDSYRGKPANILVAVGFGASMGLSPAESLYRISVIKGKPTMSAELVASQVRKAGHRLRIYKDEKAVSVRATIVRADDPEFEFSVTRDQAWAHRMGLDKPDRKGNPSNYIKMPITMLTWRSITAVAREACPEALYGAGYTPDEIQDISDEVHAEVQPEEKPETVKERPESKPVEPSPSREDCRRISKLLADGGVDSKEKAAIALKSLTGRDIHSTEQLTVVEAEQLLFSPDIVAGRVKDALWNAAHPDIEPPHEMQDTGKDGSNA
ncbi:MAG: hypothetical protein ABF747_02420 [Bifidobacterium sp.]|uniref:RecT family protein n=1 Tax=Bifidobacterium fermentum TaxID=3059035 RepID=A0AB39UQV3_9BIFI